MDALDRTFRHLVQTIQARYPDYLSQPFEVAELYQNILPYRHHRRELGLETNQDYELVLLQLLAGARDYLIVDDGMRARLAEELATPNPDPGAFREFATTRVALSPAAVRRFESGSTDARDAQIDVAPTVEIPAPRPSAANAAPQAPPAHVVRTSHAAARESAQRTTSQRAAVAPAGEPPSSTAPRAASSRAGATGHPPSSSPSVSASAAPTAPRGGPALPGAGVSRPSAAVPAQPSAPVATPSVGRTSHTITPQAGESCRYCGGQLPSDRRITYCPHCGQNLTVVNCLACGTELDLGWKFCTTCGRPATGP